MERDTRDAIIAAVVTTAAIVVQVILTDPGAKIAARAWWERVKAEWHGVTDAYDGGEAFVEAIAHRERGALIDEAVRYTREAVE